MIIIRTSFKEFINDLITLTSTIYKISDNAVKTHNSKIIFENQSPYVADFYEKWKKIFDIELDKRGVHLKANYSIILPIFLFRHLTPFNLSKLGILSNLLEQELDFDLYFKKLYQLLTTQPYLRQINNKNLETHRYYLFLMKNNTNNPYSFLTQFDDLSQEISYSETPTQANSFVPVYLKKFSIHQFNIKDYLKRVQLVEQGDYFIPNMTFWNLSCFSTHADVYPSINEYLTLGNIKLNSFKDYNIFRNFKIFSTNHPFYKEIITKIIYSINLKYFKILDLIRTSKYDSFDSLFTLFLNKDPVIEKLLETDWIKVNKCVNAEKKAFQLKEHQNSELYKLLIQNLDIIVHLINGYYSSYSSNSRIFFLFTQLQILIHRVKLKFQPSNVLFEVTIKKTSYKHYLELISDFFSRVLIQSIIFHKQNSLLILTWMEDHNLGYLNPLIETFNRINIEFKIHKKIQVSLRHSYLLPSSKLFNKEKLEWDFSGLSIVDEDEYYQKLFEEEQEFAEVQKERIDNFLTKANNFIK